MFLFFILFTGELKSKICFMKLSAEKLKLLPGANKVLLPCLRVISGIDFVSI